MTSITRRLNVSRDKRADKKAAYSKWLRDFKDATLINTYKSAGLVVPAGLASDEPYRPLQRRIERDTKTGAELQYVWFEQREGKKWHRL